MLFDGEALKKIWKGSLRAESRFGEVMKTKRSGKKEISFGNMVNSVTKKQNTEGKICNQKAGVISFQKK